MLRNAVLAAGALLLAGGLVALLAARQPAGLAFAVLGALLLVALLIERRGYKRVLDSAPGPDWQPTGERFRQPGSDIRVAVWYQPRTGKRAYVRIGGQPPQ